ncbi:hypothetical protein I312_105472 [Cryptococcus bacillisporus CA1280]|uniref:uncharacterized protein n=1 Tax=Cryptococcus bacillisporus CA1280 TaxID=1296109 RepID=UPI0033684115
MQFFVTINLSQVLLWHMNNNGYPQPFPCNTRLQTAKLRHPAAYVAEDAVQLYLSSSSLPTINSHPSFYP